MTCRNRAVIPARYDITLAENSSSGTGANACAGGLSRALWCSIFRVLISRSRRCVHRASSYRVTNDGRPLHKFAVPALTSTLEA